MRKGKLRFAVIPSRITSKSDGDRHYVSASDLVRLYGLQLGEYVVVEPSDPHFDIKTDGLIELWPLYNGNYREFIASIREHKNV